MQTLNAKLVGGLATTPGVTGATPALAQRVGSSNGTATQLIVPSDKSTADALEAALPTVKKVVAIHQCIKNIDGSRLLNSLAVPGNENSIFRSYAFVAETYPIGKMQYHDKNKCVGVRAIDQVTLLARNTLRVRVVYFAEDSGEANNFFIQVKRVEDDSWKLDQISPVW